MSLVRMLAVSSAVTWVGAATAHAEDNGRAGVAYGTAGAELATVGVIALYEYTAASPGHGVGLAINFLPIVAGIGVGILGEMNELDSRYPLAFHGAIAGGLPLLAIGAVFDGRDAYDGVRLGPAALTLGVLGAAGGAYLGATRVDDLDEGLVFASAPFLGALGGGITFAVVHFVDDQGPRSTGRLVKYAGVGMLLGTVGSLAYAFPARDGAVSRRVASSGARDDRATVLSLGGVF